ncbi:MAG: sigma-70 family RNA polymerase sigma factor, partial [Deltaproteobacteria bacterium]|nr:sigma-70 family RNA polymerase sigma factor [Deltaproteobacteria bacterium]
LHDSFLEAWQHASEYDPKRSSVRTWLLLRLRSRCLDRIRSADRLRPVDELPPEKAEPQEESPELSPDRARARRALDSLPEAQRTVLELAYFGGLTGAQIAEKLGVPLGTVKTRVALGLAKLREQLADPDPQGSSDR